MKTNELIALLQRIEHHNGGPLTMVLTRRLSGSSGWLIEIPGNANADTGSFIQAGQGLRPRVAVLQYDIDPARVRLIPRILNAHP